MEKFNLSQTGQEVQNILDNATPQSDLTAEVERAQEAERVLGEGVQQNANDIDTIDGKIPSAATSENKLTDKEYVDGQVDDEKSRAQGVEGTLQDNIDAEEARAQVAEGTLQSNIDAEEARATEAEQTLQGNIDAEEARALDAEGTLQDNIDAEELRAKAAEEANANDIDAIEAKIPSGASSENKLATESYVDDAVATSSATFRGTFNLVSDLHLTLEATHANIATALATAIATADNNDFAFVLIPTDAETPTVIGSIERYKFNGTDWAYEYTLNNSGFTQEQWDAINSGITSGDVTKLAALPTNAELTLLLNGLAGDIGDEETRAKAAELALQGAIGDEETRAKAAEKANADDIDAIEEKIPSSASSSNQLATASDVDSLSAAIEAILLLIPTAASSLNQLADKAFVNSSISTATATFRGTFNLVNDLHLTLAATHAQIGTALASAISDEDKNDYCFVQIPTVETAPNEITQTDRYKFNGTSWEYEYTLNNSGFTSAQWTAINSGITSALVSKLSALPTNADITTALGVLTSSITTINQKIPSAASQANQLIDTAAMESYIVQVLNVLTASFNVTSSDGHVTVQISQVDGKITSFALTTLDIASAASLSLVEGRVTTAEGNISTNSADIAILQDAYAALTQSDLVIVKSTDTWPVASPATSTIYRVVDRTNTPPQYYSDYMWNGTAMVPMATYDNAIDPRPKKASLNLVTSGGVFDNMGALDVSELNATENPHTLAQYVDLSAALAAVPPDYRKGGMSVKFVQSSDNNYVQYRYMSSSTAAADFTNVDNWQGVDDEPVAGSKNLIESRGVFSIEKGLNDITDKVYLNQSQTSTISDAAINAVSETIVSSPNGFMVLVYKFDEVKLLKLTVLANYGTAILTDSLPAIGVSGNLIMSGVAAGNSLEVQLPTDKYLCIMYKNSNRYNVKVEKCDYVLSGVDDNPTKDSSNLVKSGGAYSFSTAFKGILTASDNIDSLTQEGNFFVNATITAGTYPDDLNQTYVTLLNYGNGKYWTQILVSSDSSGSQTMWFRVKFNNTWRLWHTSFDPYKGVLTASDNIDNIKNTGVYIVNSTLSAGTYPSGMGTYGILYCYGFNNFRTQILTTLDSNASTWIRTYINSQYTAWNSLTSNVEALIGVKMPNLLILPTQDYSYNGIDYTMNADGSITLDGTCSPSNSYLDLSLTLNRGVYTLWGMPSSSTRANYHYYISVGSNNAYFGYLPNGYSFIVENDNTSVTIWIRVMKDIEVDEVTFYPMLTRQNYEMINFVKPNQYDFRDLYSHVDITNYGWSGKKMALIGDSITDGANAFGFSSMGDIVARILNLEYCNNYGISGCAMASRTQELDTTYPPVVSRWDDMEADADIIYVHAGTNDWSSQVPLGASDSQDPQTFNGALNIIMSGLKAKYSDKLIVFDTILNRIGYDDVNYGGAGSKPILTSQYSQCIIDKCKEYQIVYHDVYTNFGLDLKYDKENNLGLLTDDGLHPNARGTQVFGRKVAAFIKSK